MKRTLAYLDEAARHYYFTELQTGIDNRCRARLIARCVRDVRGARVLELGFMDGQWTDRFLAQGCRVVVVEGARRNVEFGRAKYRDDDRVELLHGLFEDYEPTGRFDVILMGGMLKHLPDPLDLLRRSRRWLAPGGLLIATTPNARSLHRRVGVRMGLLGSLDDLTSTDREVGSLRHYDLESFRSLLVEGGYRIEELSTALLKPVSSERMRDWPDDLLDALDGIADEIPDYGWYIYALCR